MRTIVAGALAVCVVAAASGCYPDEIDSVSDLSSVITLVDTSTPPLHTARTFAIPDTVIHSLRKQGAGVIGHEGDAQVLARIRGHFLQLGWREITDVTVERPDVVVLVGVFEQTNTGVAYTGWWGDWGYWGGWPAYGPDWTWGVPVGAVEFTFESGTLAMVMLDLRNGNTTLKEVPILWAGAIQGVLAASSSNLDRALRGIDQAFVQSPYLERP